MESKWTCYFNKEAYVGGPWFGWKQTGIQKQYQPQQARNKLSMLSLCSFQGCFVSVAEPSMP